MDDWIILAILGAGGYYLWEKDKEEKSESQASEPILANNKSEMTPFAGLGEVVVRDKSVKRGSVIHFTLTADATDVTVEIHRPGGAGVGMGAIRVRRHVIGNLKAGPHSWRWNGNNDWEEKVAAGLYFASVACDYGKVPTEKIPVGGVYGCVENLVREGWDLSYAAKQCEVTLPELAKNPEIRDCIVRMIKESASFSVALSGCKGLVLGGPSKTLPPEPTYTVADEPPMWDTPPPLPPPLPPPNGDNGKTVPDWMWAVIAAGGLLVFSTIMK